LVGGVFVLLRLRISTLCTQISRSIYNTDKRFHDQFAILNTHVPAFDKGVSIEGMELPFNQAQAVFIHDSAKVPNAPDSIPALVAWIKANPGRFVYSDPTKDFTGAALLRHFFYHFAGDNVVGGSWQDFLGEFNEALYVARAPLVWAALRDLQSSLYRPVASGTTSWYPDSQ
jgi:putative spermidine/putrescine transport system substrate-binding protein